MAFGFSFAAKKSKTDTTTNVDKTETGTQSGNETTSGTQTNTSQTSGSTQNTGTGTSATTGTSSTGTTGSTTGRQTGSTRSLGENVMGGLEGAVTSLLTNILNPSTGDRAMLTRGMDAMGNFDVDSYVNSSLQAAKAQQGTHLDEVLGSIFSRVGGAEGNNSASTLLAERARNDSAATLAGVAADSRAKGEQILANNLQAQTGAVGAMGQQLLPMLAQILKGGVTETDTTNLQEQIQNVLAQQQGTTQTAESSGQTTQGTSTTTETLLQEILKNLTSNTHTVGTEHTKGTTSEKGGGASLSL